MLWFMAPEGRTRSPSSLHRTFPRERQVVKRGRIPLHPPFFPELRTNRPFPRSLRVNIPEPVNHLSLRPRFSGVPSPGNRCLFQKTFPFPEKGALSGEWEVPLRRRQKRLLSPLRQTGLLPKTCLWRLRRRRLLQESPCPTPGRREPMAKGTRGRVKRQGARCPTLSGQCRSRVGLIFRSQGP